MNLSTPAPEPKPIKTLVTAASLFAVLLTSGCDRGKPTGSQTAQPTVIKLRQEWFPNANYAGALFAAREFATNNGISISIQRGSDTIDAVKMVMAGTDQIGDAGADKVLDAIDKGANLVIIGVLNLHSPTCFMAPKRLHVLSPKDFEGKKVGVLPGTATEYVYRALMKKAGVNMQLVNEKKDAPFDPATFFAGDYDIRPAFIYDEPVTADLKNLEFTNRFEYDIVEPKLFGVQFMGTVYFTTKRYATQNREAVQGFIDAAADGWRAALKYPDRAIQYLKDFEPTTDVRRETMSLEKARPYFEGKDGKVLAADLADWQEMTKILTELGVVHDIDISKCVDSTFVNNYYFKMEKKR